MKLNFLKGLSIFILGLIINFCVALDLYDLTLEKAIQLIDENIAIDRAFLDKEVISIKYAQILSEKRWSRIENLMKFTKN